MRGMRLLFDHGTLVLADPPDLRLDFVPGLLWDPRVALFRAPALRYADMLQALRARGLPCGVGTARKRLNRRIRPGLPGCSCAADGVADGCESANATV